MGGQNRGSGADPDANRFLRFSQIKHSFYYTFLSQKDTPVPAMSAGTIDILVASIVCIKAEA